MTRCPAIAKLTVSRLANTVATTPKAALVSGASSACFCCLLSVVIRLFWQRLLVAYCKGVIPMCNVTAALAFAYHLVNHFAFWYGPGTCVLDDYEKNLAYRG